MKICTFLGHVASYDEHLHERIVEAAERIVNENDEVDFWLFELQGTGYYAKSFYDICLEAVVEVKQHFTDKSVIITKVVKNADGNTYTDNLCHHRTLYPSCLIDHVVVAPHFPNLKVKDVTVEGKKTMRWIISKADYLVSYIYSDFYLAESRLLPAARNKIIYDVTNSATRNLIKETAEGIDGRDGEILRRLLKGDTISDIAHDIGVSSNAIRHFRSRACLKVRRTIIQQMKERQYMEETKNPCDNHALKAAVLNVSMDGADYRDALKQAVDYLVATCHVTEFYILCDITHTHQVEFLQQVTKRYPFVQLVAVTHYSNIEALSREEWRNAAGPHCPPSHAVVNINTFTDDPVTQSKRAIQSLMDQSVFCVCGLDDESAQTGIITECLANVKTAKLLDMRKKYQISDTIYYDTED